MARADEGLKSEHLNDALSRALGGDGSRLSDLLARFGGLPGPRPNHTLAGAFGEAIGAPMEGTRSRAAAQVLEALGGDDAAPDTARVFLPIAAAFGWAARLRSVKSRGDRAACERALIELAADERTPVRTGTIAALVEHAAREQADSLVALLGEVLADDDRERRWGAAGALLEVFTDRRALAPLGDRDALLEHVTTLIADLADAPRAAERSDARRRALLALGPLAAALASTFRDAGVAWLEARCADATHPDLRRALDTALSRLRARGDALRPEELARLGEALAGSAKPPRDPSRIREGTGRGKKRARRGA